MNDIQKQVQEAIDQLVESGAERGLQVAVYHQGELVVDAVAGVADPATGRPVGSDTVFYTYSVGKAMASTLVHMLVELGMFGYDTTIAKLWPDFGAHGKETVTVRHVLTHTAGVPGVPADTTPEDLCDWDKMCSVIADTKPWWEPGTKVAYHAYTFGYIVGELIRQATGKPISQLLREEIAEPLGVDDELYFGVPESELGRLARLEDTEGSAEMLAAMPDDSPFFAMGPRTVTPTAQLGNRADILMADIPAGGKMTARAMARMYAALLGEVDGVRLLSPERLREVTTLATTGNDELLGIPATWTLGYSTGAPGPRMETVRTLFGVGGVGGSFAYGDTARGIGFALAKNRLAADFETADRIAEIVTKAVAER